MFELALITGLVVAGVLVGVLRNKRSSHERDVPNPFRRGSR